MDTWSREAGSQHEPTVSRRTLSHTDHSSLIQPPGTFPLGNCFNQEHQQQAGTATEVQSPPATPLHTPPPPTRLAQHRTKTPAEVTVEKETTQEAGGEVKEWVTPATRFNHALSRQTRKNVPEDGRWERGRRSISSQRSFPCLPVPSFTLHHRDRLTWGQREELPIPRPSQLGSTPLLGLELATLR